jgi:hypothetical protein
LRQAIFTILVQIINYFIDNVQELYIIKTVDSSIRYILNQIYRHHRRANMSNYELQILKTGQLYDAAIRAAESEGIEVLSSVVPGSRLHEIINNPVDSGIDEG